MPPGRTLIVVLWFALGVHAWTQQAPDAAPPEPPEEDEALSPKEYSFNPVQAQKELQIGNFYFKKGSFRAAAGRYLEATKWNPGLAEAYLRLGEAYERLKAVEQARKAYEKILELEPKSKMAEQARKRLAQLPAEPPKNPA